MSDPGSFVQHLLNLPLHQSKRETIGRNGLKLNMAFGSSVDFGSSLKRLQMSTDVVRYRT